MDVQRFYEIYLSTRIYIKEAYIYVWRRTYDERAFFFMTHASMMKITPSTFPAFWTHLLQYRTDTWLYCTVQ
jgi:hypothetical protein